jgi:hypothetical protein
MDEVAAEDFAELLGLEDFAFDGHLNQLYQDHN